MLLFVKNEETCPFPTFNLSVPTQEGWNVIGFKAFYSLLYCQPLLNLHQLSLGSLSPESWSPHLLGKSRQEQDRVGWVCDGLPGKQEATRQQGRLTGSMDFTWNFGWGVGETEQNIF